MRTWAGLRFLGVSVGVLVGISAPGAQAESSFDRPTTGAALAPVIGGVAVGPGEWPSVVAIVSGKVLCTGTLLSPSLVLTAAHCLPSAVGPQRTKGEPEIAIWAGREQEGPPTALAASWAQHPNWCGSANCAVNPHDFGFIVLDQRLEISNYPPPITNPEEWTQLMVAETPVGIVGYGQDDVGESGAKRVAASNIRFISDDGERFFAGGEGRDSCQGDSGGPAFVRTAGDELRLAGVLASGSNPCGQGGYYGSPISALDWLRREAGYGVDGCSNYDCILEGQAGCRAVANADANSPWLALISLFPVYGLAMSRARRRRCVGPRARGTF